MDIQKYIDQIVAQAIDFAPSLAMALIILFVGIKVINKMVHLTDPAMKKAGINDSLRSFIGSMLGLSFKVLLLFSVAGIVGIETTSFIAVLAAAGFAVGLALQGSLSNFAAGIIILVFRPYRVGDWIEVDGKFGKVEEIQIFNTLLSTPGKKTLIIPNGQIVDNAIINFSLKENIRLELTAVIPYEESFPRVKALLAEAMRQVPGVLSSPEPEIGIASFDTHYVVLAVRPYVSPENYWPVTFSVNEMVKRVFHENGVRMAYSEGVDLGEIGA